MPLLGSRGAASLTGFGGLAKLGYLLRNSLRFRASNSAYLNRTPSVAGNRRTFTYSGWIKRGTSFGVDQCIFGCNNGNSDDNAFEIFFTTANVIGVVAWNFYYLQTTQVFRDPAAWYHIVVAVDTTNATANNRMRMYINGVEVTAFGTRTNPTQNTDLPVNNTLGHQIGAINYVSSGGLTRYFDGYMAEVNFIDGQQLTPSSFGKTDGATGQWLPIKYAGTYGTNGFYLPFSNTASTSTLGNDFSGRGTTWTVNNISLTAGVTYDGMTDVPTLTSATAANYATLNPLAAYGSNMAISNGSLTSSATSTNDNRGWPSTIAAPGSGKWYAEFTFTATNGDNNGGCGIMLENGTGVPGEIAGTVSWKDFGIVRQNAASTTYGSALSTNDIVMVAYDAALGRVWFGRNGTWFASGDPATNANPSATGITTTGRFATYHFNTSAVIHANFGQRPFAYTPPSGFNRLNVFNLP